MITWGYIISSRTFLLFLLIFIPSLSIEVLGPSFVFKSISITCHKSHYSYGNSPFLINILSFHYIQSLLPPTSYFEFSYWRKLSLCAEVSECYIVMKIELLVLIGKRPLLYLISWRLELLMVSDGFILAVTLQLLLMLNTAS